MTCLCTPKATINLNHPPTPNHLVLHFRLLQSAYRWTSNCIPSAALRTWDFLWISECSTSSIFLPIDHWANLICLKLPLGCRRRLSSSFEIYAVEILKLEREHPPILEELTCNISQNIASNLRYQSSYNNRVVFSVGIPYYVSSQRADQGSWPSTMESQLACYV